MGITLTQNGKEVDHGIAYPPKTSTTRLAVENDGGRSYCTLPAGVQNDTHCAKHLRTIRIEGGPAL